MLILMVMVLPFLCDGNIHKHNVPCCSGGYAQCKM